MDKEKNKSQQIANIIQEYVDIEKQHQDDLKLLKKEFPKSIVGYSDHSPENISAIAAVALGAMVIEKHITLDKKTHGPDHAFALRHQEYRDDTCKLLYDADSSHRHTRVDVCEFQNCFPLLSSERVQ